MRILAGITEARTITCHVPKDKWDKVCDEFGAYAWANGLEQVCSTSEHLPDPDDLEEEGASKEAVDVLRDIKQQFPNFDGDIIIVRDS